MKYNPNLPNIKCKDGLLPVHYAALYGKRDMLQYLLRIMSAEVDIYSGKDGTELLRRLIYGNLYDIALRLLKRHEVIGRDRMSYRKKLLEVMAEKPLAFKSGSRLGRLQRLIYNCIPVEKENISSIQITDNQIADRDIESLNVRSFGSIGKITSTFGQMCNKLYMILWNVLMHLAPAGVKDLHEQKARHMQAVEIVGIICEGVNWTNPKTKMRLRDAFFKAARLGIFEFVREIIKAYNGSVYWVNQEKHTIFHVAVLHRRSEVFNLIHSSNFKLNWLGIADNDRNNILHFAGRLVPSSEVAGAALQMQRELQWFKAVENLVHPQFREAENKLRQTPRDVFTQEHKELVKEGEKWMKETSTSCSVVAALIITVTFAAAFTAPGGNDSQGVPNLLHESSFIIFAVSDALSLFSSIISVLMFLGILTSRYSEEDFLLSLPRKLIIGLIAMFFSIASIIVAFAATIYLVLFRTWKWVFVPISLVGCVPVTLFAFLQFPLLVEMYSSTYGRGIFGRK